jgi:hypothetical protein
MNTDELIRMAVNKTNTMIPYRLSNQDNPFGIHQNEIQATININKPMHKIGIHIAVLEANVKKVLNDFRP